MFLCVSIHVCIYVCAYTHVHVQHALLQEQGKGLEKLAKRFRHDISLIKNGVSTCFGLNGRAAIAKYKAGSAALVNSLDKEHELAEEAGVSLDQAFDLYEAELKQNRCVLYCIACLHTAMRASYDVGTLHCSVPACQTTC